MKDLIEDIRKKEFQKVYLLCGEEPYLRQLYKKKLTEAVLPEGDTMNLSVYTGKNVDPKAVIDQAETMPFFADKRLILLEDTGFFKNASPEPCRTPPVWSSWKRRWTRGASSIRP